MNTRKSFVRILAALFAMMLLLTACSSKPAATEPAAEASAQIANPVSEVTAEEMTQQTGLVLDACDSAENIRFFVINGQPKVAQVDFDLNGKAYTYRAAATQMDATALSGIYFGSCTESSAQVSYNEGKLLTEDKTAVLYWEDVVPGISYTLTCTDCDDPAVLQEIAEAVFVPAQGDSDG